MKNFKKFLALSCSAVLTASALSGCASTEDPNASSEEITVIQEALDGLEDVADLVKHSATAGKEETVYAILNANGDQEQTIVSNWLKNPDGAAALEDVSELTDIKIVKGSAEYTQEKGSNQILWSNDGSDIYYQGTSTKELPVDVHISYELDGVPVTAKELSGASGHLKMTFTYTNHLSKQVTIQGRSQTIYQPFFMVSGMMLDNEKAQNVTVDHGSTVNSGDDTIVFGIAVPGLKESLGLNNAKDENGKPLDLDLPETVTVEADVTDFSLMMTLTLASNNALSQLGFDEIDSIDDLKADIEQLSDGMDELLDGSSRLTDGVSKLKDGAGSLSSGTNTLAAGASSLAGGAQEVSDGAAKVNNGAAALKNGTQELKDKVPELSGGISTLAAGSQKLSGGIQKLTSKNETLVQGSSALSQNLSVLNNSLSSDEAAAKLKTLVEGSDSFKQGLSDASGNLSLIKKGYDYSSDELSALLAGLSAYAEGLNATKDPASMAYAGYIQTLIEAYKGLYDKLSAVSSGISTLSSTYGDINDGIGETAESINSAAQAVSQLASGASDLNKGVSDYVNGVNDVADGIKTLDTGISTLTQKVPQLAGGIDQLASGAMDLASGSASLAQGASQVASGAEQVNSGSSSLNSGAASLFNGISELSDGASDLKAGISKFNDEGIQKLVNLINEDLETYFDRFKALQDYAKEYTTYSGCDSSVECSVKFIYKTGAIK